MYVDVSVRLIIRVNEGADLEHIINEMEYSFRDQTGDCNIEDTEITNFHVKDSK